MYGNERNPLKGDWIKLLEKDLDLDSLFLEDEKRVSNLTKITFKSEVIKKIFKRSNFQLECPKMKHDKASYSI